MFHRLPLPRWLPRAGLCCLKASFVYPGQQKHLLPLQEDMQMLLAELQCCHLHFPPNKNTHRHLPPGPLALQPCPSSTAWLWEEPSLQSRDSLLASKQPICTCGVFLLAERGCCGHGGFSNSQIQARKSPSFCPGWGRGKSWVYGWGVLVLS